MLDYLRIRNLALIEDMELEFAPGMNVLTGETGAGKSFILKALGFLLGERLKPDMVRAGADRAHVEALFAQAGPDGGDLILRRELLATGRSRFWVNDEMKTQETAKELRERLIAYTSQHGQQQLLQPAFQDRLMEETLDCPELLARRDDLLRQLEGKRARLEELEAKRARIGEVRDLLEMQQQEIDRIHPEPNEDEELEALRVRARRCEEAAKDYNAALALLHGEDGPGIMDLLADFSRLLARMGEHDEALATSLGTVDSLREELQHISSVLRHPPEMEDMPRDLDAVEERLYQLSQLKRKLRRTLPQIMELKQEIAEKISFLDVCNLDIMRITREEEALAAELSRVVAEIAPRRHAGCEAFARRLEDALKGLGFSDRVRVQPDYVPVRIWEGVDDEKVRILWAPNPGQPAQPLDKIASGGELSRFLLALAGILPMAPEATFIFDEVDSGVGGLTLNCLADRLDELSASHQMLLITHWPQIAIRADRHFQITKVVRDERTFTLCRPLDAAARREEISRMAGGGEQGEAMATALGSVAAGARRTGEEK